MRSVALAILLWLFLPTGPTGPALAGNIPFTTINQSLVADRLLPVGSEVKIKILRISDQFNAGLTVVCLPESPFKAGEPGTASFDLKQWLAKDLQVGDVLRYTTTLRGFIGFTAGPDYRVLRLDNLEGGYRLSLEYRDHQWLVEVSFPDYD